jgi:nicotinamidase-related amidase
VIPTIASLIQRAPGVATNVCVLGMARELADSNFDVCVVSDACSTLGEAAQRATLKVGIPVFGSVATSDELQDWRPL